jgi:ABC-type sugar transport system substrate-binding protein
MIDEVKKLGGTPIDTVTASVTERTNAIENYISKGVDAIIIQEGDIKMVAPALEEAKKRGIIIVSMDAGIADFVDIVVESNNWNAGLTAALELMDRIDGKGKIVEIYNDLGQMIRMRRKELYAVISEYPGVEIVAGFTYAWPDFFPDAKSKMEAVLQAHPDIVGVFATFDGVGCAAAQAIREAGLQDQIVVVGIDGDPNAYEEMRKPGSPFKATVAQDPDTIARVAVRMAFKLLNGEEIPGRHIFIPAKLVTIENLPEPGKRFPDEE